jgi:hypothetical protein
MLMVIDIRLKFGNSQAKRLVVLQIKAHLNGQGNVGGFFVGDIERLQSR